MLKSLKKAWLRFVTVWNRTVIFCLLFVIWFLVLSPTAVIRRLFQKMFYSRKEGKSFLKKSSSLASDHFKNPF